MYVINSEERSIYVTRGDSILFDVAAEATNGDMYQFKVGDVVRMKIFKKNNAKDVVLQKNFPITSKTGQAQIYLSGDETKIGDVISKPVDYWYEIELNPDTEPQTIVGYDEDGAKIFRLFPEGADVAERSAE